MSNKSKLCCYTPLHRFSNFCDPFCKTDIQNYEKFLISLSSGSGTQLILEAHEIGKKMDIYASVWRFQKDNKRHSI
jgi:hypothetical protein